MNKLLQHIMNAGDVNHKILPTYQMRGEVKYDNIPRPASMRSKAELDYQFKKMLDAQTQAAQNAQRYGVIRQAEAPQSIASKAWSIATNPMTALAYKVQGKDIPDYFERGPKNSLDIAANMVNPFAIAESIKSIPGNLARGEFLNAGLNALNVIPAAKVASKVIKTAAPNVNKAVQAFGPNSSNKGFINYMTARGVEFNPGAIVRDYNHGIQSGLVEAIPNALGSALRKTGIYPKARTVGRPFSEVFPTGAKKAQAIKAQDEAFDNAMNFVNEYNYPGGSQELRPVLADKIRFMYPNVTGSPENFNRLSNGNPFNKTVDRLATSTSWGAGREGLDLNNINYINRNRGSIGGFNDTNNLIGGSSITLRNYGPYYKTPYEIARTAVHEAGHTAQKLGYVPNFKNPSVINTPLTWGDEIAQYDDKLKYYTSNPNGGLGRFFGKSMVVPNKSNVWESSPNELHSELIAEKYGDYLKYFNPKNPNVGLQSKTLNRELIDQLADPSDEVLMRILERGRLDKHFRPEATTEDKLRLLRMLPAAVPAIGAGILGTREQKYGGENNMFRVFAQEGVEYQGPSIVDYLATKGYSGKKAFRKDLAEKYSIEDYNFSAAKNTELLNRLRENDDLLQQNYEPTQAPIPVERMMEMERQARAAREASSQPAVSPAPVYNYSPEFQNMRIPQTKVNTSLQPKVIYDNKFSLSPKMVVQVPAVPRVTAPVNKVVPPVTAERPQTVIPKFDPYSFLQNSNQRPLGPVVTNRPITREAAPIQREQAPIPSISKPMDETFMFPNEYPYSFNKQEYNPISSVVPANKPLVKTEKYTTESETEDASWYDKAASTLKGFYDDFATSVNKSPLDFRGMNFGTGFSPEGAKEMTTNAGKSFLSLFSDDLAEKFQNKIDRQDAINNPKERKSTLDPSKIMFDPINVTGDTIPDAGGRRYHIPEVMDLDYMRFGVRNRGDYKELETEGAPITTFEPFQNSKQYFAKSKDPANSTYIGVAPDGKIKVGGKDQFLDQEYQVTRTFGNKVVDFNRDDKGSIIKVASNPKASKETLSPSVKVMGEDGKVVDGKLSLLLPREGNQEESFDLVTGGRYIFQTPDGKTKLVSGSLKNIEDAFYNMKKNNPYVNVITLDNGSYARGIRTFDQKLTKQDLKGYDNQNTGGGNIAYILPGVSTRYESKFSDFEKEAKAKLQAKYPGKKVSVGYQDSGLYDETGSRDIESQAAIQQKGNSQTPVSLHNFGAARDYILYVDGKPIDAGANKDLYADILWSSAAKTGLHHVGSKEDNWDPTHIGLAKEGQKTAFDELYSKYPDIFANPNFVKSLNFINKNKSNPNYKDYYELLNNIEPFTGQPRITESMRTTASRKEDGGPIIDPRGQWAHPGKITRIPSDNITMQGVPYPVFGVGSNGQKQMMYPEQDYNFGGASYVDEYPMMRNGGGLLSRTVSCSDCGWSWKAAEGGIDPLTCHKCGGTVKMQVGGTLPKMQMAGSLLQPISAENISNFLSLLSVPQKLITKAVTGKYQTPSEAMGIKNPYGAFATDAVLDPVNLVGAGLLGKVAKASTKSGLLSNTYKINPLAFKPKPNAQYRMIGEEGLQDALESGVIRNNPKGQYVKDAPYFSEGFPINGRQYKTSQSYGNYGGPNMIEVTGENFIKGVGPKSKSYITAPIDELKVTNPNVKFYKEDWLKGYKEVKLPNKKTGGQHGGLDRWFAEKWVDVKTGKDCGRQEGESRAGYPACRPSKRVNSQTPKTSSEMSSAEKAKFKSSKTSSQRIDYNHKRNK